MRKKFLNCHAELVSASHFPKNKILKRVQDDNCGFTLIELIIVIAIIGVLAGMIMFALNPVLQLQKARDGQRKADLRQIQSALEIYRSDIGNYPTFSTGQQPVDSESGLKNCPSTSPTSFGNPGSSGNPACSNTYLKKIPTDPKNTETYPYLYSYIENGKAYNLTACLENGDDLQIDKEDTSGNKINCTGSAALWQYTVSNP